MVKAMWNGALLAESDRTVVVEGNHYFPPDSLDKRHFKKSNSKTNCPWKGDASYFHLEVDGQVNEDAAWTYLTPKEEAAQIRGFVAFWKGVTVES